MIKISIEMPLVSACSATECTYNSRNACHARAITVGDGVHPGCDTFFGNAGASHVKSVQRTAGVGACKVSDCTHNDDYECVADSITVGTANSDDAISCLTYRHR